MKLKKKTAMILSFAVGTTMFATTAMAEVVSKNGYDQLKDSLKYTAEACTTKLPNYTTDISFVLKDNGKVIASENSVGKYDVKSHASENTNSSNKNGVKGGNYHYYDKNTAISKYDNEDVYFVVDYQTAKESNGFKNPFKEKRASDLERIADALVGNLKDAVVVTQNPDGSKQLSGSLNESQIPALINAVVSLQSKEMFDLDRNPEYKMPKITKDIFVKDIKGSMTVNKDGVIQSVLGTGTICGKDDTGKEHVLTFELLGKLSNVNSTVVKKPDLTGKKVDKSVERDHSKLSNPEKYVGKYKSDILIEKDNKFQKIGERFIDIESITATNVSGKYYEEYLKGYESYASSKKDFKFNTEIKDKQFGGDFTATTSDNKKINGHIYINPSNASVSIHLNERNGGSTLSDNGFSRVFN